MAGGYSQAVPEAVPVAGMEAPGASRSAAVQWWLVACLLLVGVLAQIDKTVLTLLVGPIKRDMALSDTEIGLIVSAAFAVANLGISIPAGWMADRWSRRAIVASGVAVWSVTAAACGAANSFGTLFLARAGCGLGEGISPPASYSLIRDGVSTVRRGRAFSTYGMYLSVGSGLSLVVGGALVGAVVANNWTTYPVIGTVKPWQSALVIIGLAGLPFALLAYAFRDPGRSQADGGRGVTFGEAFAYLRQSRGPAVALLVFSVMHAMLTASIAAWLPAFIGRTFGLPPQVIGPTLGSLLMVAAPIGLWSAGTMMDRSATHGPAGIGVVAIIVSCVLLAAAVALPHSSSLSMFWVLETFVILTSTTYITVTSTTVSHLVPPRAIGKTMAFYLLVQSGCGVGLAPVITAVVSDTVFGGEPGALGQALSLVALVFGLPALGGAVALYATLRKSAWTGRLAPAGHR